MQMQGFSLVKTSDSEVAHSALMKNDLGTYIYPTVLIETRQRHGSSDTLSCISSTLRQEVVHGSNTIPLSRAGI
jgi:hypothetical protein